MKLLVDDKKLDLKNYECNIWIDDKKVETINGNKKHLIQLEYHNNSIIKVEYENILFREKHTYWFCLFYWILAFISGYGEQDPFGKPFNALICIKNIESQELFLQVNSIWKKEAFEVGGKCEVLENKFYSPKGFKKKWFLGLAMPMTMLILLILFIFIIVDVGDIFKTILISFLAIGGLLWLVYVIKVLKK